MKNKVAFTFFSLMILYFVVLAKAFYIQIVNREKLIAYSDSQIIRTSKIYPRRGYILDRNGEPLAINVRKYNIFAIPKKNQDISSEVRELGKTIPTINVKKIISDVKKRKKYTWIARKIKLDEKQVEAIKKLESIFIEEESSRFYPNNELAGQLLGFVGIDNEGLAGIEYFFNEKLRGKQEVRKYFKDAKGRPVKFKISETDETARDINLSIDKDIQAALEAYLKEGILKHDGFRGGAGVMDATTGEIWAIANYPTFDPNKFEEYNSEDRRLSMITDPIEPGSIFKSLTIATALEGNTVRPDTNYFCERGKFRVQNHTISESDTNHAYEWLSVEEILKLSSNIGTTKIAFDITFPVLKKSLSKFMIGEKVGIEYPGESRGIFDSKENVNPLRLSNISFGQGVATTGIQMLGAYGAFANNGLYVTPTLIKQDGSSNRDTKRIISKRTASQITEMLVKAVEEGTGRNAIVSHFSIAGKTSTAQRPVATGGYDGYISGFIGYPVNVKQKFVVYVYVIDPKKNGYYGNTVAAPIFQKIVRNILYKKKEYSQLALNTKDGEVAKGDFVKYRQSSSRHVGKGLAPNLLGLDKGTAAKMLDEMNLKYDLKGYGVLSDQNPLPGEIYNEKTVFKLRFSPPKYE